ncbi:MAG: preprotein translocase subunit Sec61beta [Candidatus Bathyarchaeota archaeon]|nr:preprotein translocase subunit Sec61beta [Candidatus Bathyarchaeota archaeon]
MSKKRRESAGMPQSSAGLMRFFQDETAGFKIPPEYVIGASLLLVAAVILARVFVPL